MSYNVIIPSTSWAVAQRINSGEPLGVFFHAMTCSHCHDAAAAIHQILGGIPVTVYGINIQHDRNLAAKVGVDGTPFLALFNGGELIGKLAGAQTADVYEQFLTTGGGGDEEGNEEESIEVTR